MQSRLAIFAIAVSMCLWPSQGPALAADGIRASAVVTRNLPIDLATVSFDLSERLDKQKIAADADKGKSIADAFAKAGMTIVSRSIAIGGFNQASGTSWTVLSGNEQGKDLYDLRRVHTFQLTGFARPEDILQILSQEGVRRTITFSLRSREWETAREQLTIEALKLATEKARAIGAALGVATGEVIDVATTGPNGVARRDAILIDDTVLINDRTAVVTDEQGREKLMQVVRVAASVVLRVKPQAN